MTSPSDRYVVISADGHAGAPLLGYKDYLEKAWREAFDGWAASFTDPWADLEENEIKMGVASADSTLSWDSARRQEALESQGIVGEVLFPNTAPPFFPGGVFTVGVPQTRSEYECRWAGLRAHNRWLVDFCAEAPGRRAGVGQIFLNDIDDAVAEIRWMADAGLTGGVLLPGDAPTALVPLYYPAYDPVWEVCADLGLPVHRHANLPGDANTPANGPAGPVVGLIESNFFAHRGLAHMIFAGVFERFPQLRFVLTESGAGWAPGYLAKLDGFYEAALVKGSIPDYFAGPALARLERRPSEYFAASCYLGASFLVASEVAMRDQIGVGKIMWGADLPHLEGTYPYSREAIRSALAGVPPDEVRMILGGTAAAVYSFDEEALGKVAQVVGPTVAEVATPLLDPPSFPDETVTPPLAPMGLPGRGSPE
ncbi:MAG: amidohydrolase family protein [Acidimicrobiia bacterium]